MIIPDIELQEQLNLYAGKSIEHPSHYADGRKYEPIDVICDWNLDFCLGNVVKYISRAGRKENEIEDLKKARFYLDYKIKETEGV